jgi:precorrin-2/cobalt-factor-2 C20-methyltransferase
MTGRLYGLGLGPGDPELVTLKALRLLRAVPVIAYPAPDQGESFALSIVAPWLERPQREIAVRFPMQPGPPPLSVYREAADRLAAALDGGSDVAYLCQGDPLFYGSFAGILAALPARFAVTIVPGVSSLTACAAAAGAPLCRGDGTLAVIPATLPEGALSARLETGDAAAVIKLGRHFAKLRHVLERLGRLDDALYIERASLPNEYIAPLAAVDPARVPYFATALVRGRQSL